jgi:hypothetical protein
MIIRGAAIHRKNQQDNDDKENASKDMSVESLAANQADDK